MSYGVIFEFCDGGCPTQVMMNLECSHSVPLETAENSRDCGSYDKCTSRDYGLSSMKFKCEEIPKLKFILGLIIICVRGTGLGVS